MTLVRSLHPHPDSPRGPAIEITVEVERTAPGRLRLRYLVSGEVGAVRPRATPSVEDRGLYDSVRTARLAA